MALLPFPGQLAITALRLQCSYTYGSAPAAFGEQDAWGCLVDPPGLLEVLSKIFNGEGFKLCAIGGDFILPGGVDYQDLHDDLGDSIRDPAGKVVLRDLPTPYISVIYPMELVDGSSVGHTLSNGTTRLIPGTANTRAPIPTFEEEPRWMKLSVAVAMGGKVIKC
jgi:hypothetical protein